jgi:hypothetical protein
MVKAKFKNSVRARTDTAMKNEVLAKSLCRNVCCVIQAQYELAQAVPVAIGDARDGGARPPAVGPAGAAVVPRHLSWKR